MNSHEQYEEEQYIIPENFAQEGYVKSFRIVNLIEAALIAVLFGAVVYFLPLRDTVAKITVYIVTAGFPVLLSLNGISGDCLTKTVLNFIRNKKNAKIFGPPSDVYKRTFQKQQLKKQFRQEKEIRKSIKKGGRKNAK